MFLQVQSRQLWGLRYEIAEDAISTSVEFVFHHLHLSVERLATVIVDPLAVFVTIGKTTESFTLDLDGNCRRKRLFDMVNTMLCVCSHT